MLSQSSYLSVNDSRLHFGLGEAQSVDVEIRWPLGRCREIERSSGGSLIHVTEGSGITRTAEVRAA